MVAVSGTELSEWMLRDMNKMMQNISIVVFIENTNDSRNTWQKRKEHRYEEHSHLLKGKQSSWKAMEKKESERDENLKNTANHPGTRVRVSRKFDNGTLQPTWSFAQGHIEKTMTEESEWTQTHNEPDIHFKTIKRF